MTTFSRIIERYGDPVSLCSADSTAEETKCFIQPVMNRTAEKIFAKKTPLGTRDTARYYGFIPAEAGGCEYLICDGVSYDVIRAEQYKVNGKVSHWELLLEKREDIYERT